MAATNSEEILTDAVLEGITEGLAQFGGLLDQMAAYAKERSGGQNLSPGQELYWGGFVDGLEIAAQQAREVRPLRGIK